MDNACKLEHTPYPTYCFNLISEASCGQIALCQWDSDAKECTHKTCQGSSSIFCNLLVYIDKETGGQICQKNDAGDCVESDIDMLDEPTCQARTLNTYFWDGSACVPCVSATYS